MKPIKLYKIEVGVLLDNTDPEYEKNKIFTFGPHDPKHAYLDENTAFFTNKKKALRWLRNYVKKGVLNTYGVLSELIYDQNDPSLCYDAEDTRRIVHDIRNYGIFEDWVVVFESDLYNPQFVTYTLYKVDYNKYAKIF